MKTLTCFPAGIQRGIKVSCTFGAWYLKLRENSKMQTIEWYLERADELAQQFVNTWGLLKANKLADDFMDVFNKACDYRNTKKVADNHRENNILSEQVAAAEQSARLAFAQAYKAFEEKHETR